MEFVLIVAGALILIVAYFCIGIFAKFVLGWWMMIVGLPVLAVAAFAFGWIGAVAALLGFFALLSANNTWQGSTLYITIEHKIDRAFYYGDT